jgi:hypothetical protein
VWSGRSWVGRTAHRARGFIYRYCKKQVLSQHRPNREGGTGSVPNRRKHINFHHDHDGHKDDGDDPPFYPLAPKAQPPRECLRRVCVTWHHFFFFFCLARGSGPRTQNIEGYCCSESWVASISNSLQSNDMNTLNQVILSFGIFWSGEIYSNKKRSQQPECKWH